MMREVPVRDTDPDPYTLSRDMQVLQNYFGWLDTLALAGTGTGVRNGVDIYKLQFVGSHTTDLC